MWLLINGTKETTKVLPRLSGCCTRFQAILPEARQAGAWLPWEWCWQPQKDLCRIKGPTAQSTAGGMSWWKLDEVLHQEQNNSQLAEWREGSLKQDPSGSLHPWSGSCCSACVTEEASQWALRIGMADQKESLFLWTLTWSRPKQLDLTCKSVVLSERRLNTLWKSFHLKWFYPSWASAAEMQFILFSCFLCFLFIWKSKHCLLNH